MINLQETFSAPLAFILMFWLIVSEETSVFAQSFNEEGAARGLNLTVSTVGLGGPGVSAVDFDQDGDDDLTLGSNGTVLFYENVEGLFQLLSLEIEAPPGELKGVIWADINNDGNLDLLLSSYLGGIGLYLNIGGLVFEDITENCGISNEVSANWGVSFSDINRDGYLDLQLCRYESWNIIPESPSHQPELWTRLYLNNGDETFTDITVSAGFVIDPGTVFMGAFLDINEDLWPDNFTIIDRVPGNRLFLNNGGSFTDFTQDYGVSYPNNDVMSNTVSDYDNDGDLDIFMTNSGLPDYPSYLLQNNDGESFTNVAPTVGVEFFEFAWGAVWIDANNDGWQDLFIGNRFNDPNFFFLNNQGTFINLQSQMELENNVPSFSSAKGDFDNDGFYDIISQARSPNLPQLLMNQESQNHFVKITPHGTVSNTMAIGSWIKVYIDSSEYAHFSLCGEGYISQNSQHFIFGLGEEVEVVDSVTVWYPSGHKDSYYNLSVDSSYYFYEGETYNVNILVHETPLCEGEEALLDAGEHFSYLWNTGDTTRFISAETAGLYSVSVTNEFGISASNELAVQYIPNPIITVTISPNACSGDSTATISLQNVLDTSADSVIWNNGMEGETINSLLSGDYTYTYIDVNGCLSSGTISVVDPLELLVFASSNPADLSQSNGSVELAIFGGVAPYVVVFEGDTVGTLITDLAAGEYVVSINDAYGCSLLVNFTINSTLGTVNYELTESVLIYPNPTSGKVEIIAGSKVTRVVVYNSMGEFVWEYFPEEQRLNLEHLAVGIYFLKVELFNSSTGYFRIIKE